MIIFIFIFCRGRGISFCCNKKDSKIISDETAMDILNKRYVNGEITKDEYQQIKADISNS